jgi:hypothetical protein
MVTCDWAFGGTNIDDQLEWATSQERHSRSIALALYMLFLD